MDSLHDGIDADDADDIRAARASVAFALAEGVEGDLRCFLVSPGRRVAARDQDGRLFAVALDDDDVVALVDLREGSVPRQGGVYGEVDRLEEDVPLPDLPLLVICHGSLHLRAALALCHVQPTELRDERAGGGEDELAVVAELLVGGDRIPQAAIERRPGGGPRSGRALAVERMPQARSLLEEQDLLARSLPLDVRHLVGDEPTAVDVCDGPPWHPVFEIFFVSHRSTRRARRTG